MVGFRIPFPYPQMIDASGEVDPGASYAVYANGTTTPVTVYTDRDVGTTGVNPCVTVDDAARFPVRYVNSDALLTIVLLDSDSDEVESWDDVEPIPALDNADLANYLPLAGGTMTGAIRFKEGAAVASATSINLDASGGQTNHITGTTSISTMTLEQGAWRLLIFDASLTLLHSSNLILPASLNINTVAGDSALVFGEGSGVTRLITYNCVDGKSLFEPSEILLAVGDETTAITVGTSKLTFRMPFTMILDAIPRASLTTASSSGNPTIDIREEGASIFSTLLSINENTTTSTLATTPAVLSDLQLSDNAVMRVDITVAGTSAAGLKVLIRGFRRNR